MVLQNPPIIYTHPVYYRDHKNQLLTRFWATLTDSVKDKSFLPSYILGSLLQIRVAARIEVLWISQFANIVSQDFVVCIWPPSYLMMRPVGVWTFSLRVLESCFFQHYHQQFVPTDFSIPGTNIPHWITWLRQWRLRRVQENQLTMLNEIYCEFDQ